MSQSLDGKLLPSKLCMNDSDQLPTSTKISLINSGHQTSDRFLTRFKEWVDSCGILSEVYIYNVQCAKYFIHPVMIANVINI